MLKKAPASRQAGIYPALRGIALILALLDEEGYLIERGTRDSVSRKDGKRTRVLSNRASYCGVNFVGNGFKPFPTKDFGRLASRHF
ncbi:MAG: hypothetical protein MUP41_04995 [Desulfobacterales bacterium]|nr:hypothetical protein [Desulfobacterales bacterium]